MERQQFQVPLIGTCIIFLRKRADTQAVMKNGNEGLEFDPEAANARRENVVKFFRVYGQMAAEELLRVLREEGLPERQIVERSDYAVYCVRQDELRNERKWIKFFAPRIVHDLLRRSELIELQRVFEIERGITSGANDFFYMTKEEAQSRDIPRKYVRPLIKSVGQAEYIEFGENDTEWVVLDLHGAIERIVRERGLDRLRGAELRGKIIDAIREEGDERLAHYLEEAERKGTHERPTVVGRAVWFDLGSLTIPLLIFTKEYWRHAVCCTNPSELALDQHLYALTPIVAGDANVFGGIMNCALIPLFREIYGREASGEALNRNEFTVAEAKRLPILAAWRISKEKEERIGFAFKKLVKAERRVDAKGLAALRRELDATVLGSMEMEDRLDEVYAAIDEYIRRRTEAGGLRKRVQVF